MKIFLYKSSPRSQKYMSNITQIVKYSLRDLGYEVSTELEYYDKCDTAIFIRQPFVEPIVRRKNVRHILYQVELYHPQNRNEIDGWYTFGWDDIWDSNEERRRGKFLPIGYHPYLTRSMPYIAKTRDVGFVGGMNNRRAVFYNQIQTKWEVITTFDPYRRILEMSRSRINLNLHAYDYKTYVEWDRVGHFLANDLFFISEKMPLHLNIPYFETPEQYDNLITLFMKTKEDTRKGIATQAGKQFRKLYDMRNWLKELL